MTHLKILIDANPITGSNRTGVGYYTTGLMDALCRSGSVLLTGYYFNFLGRHDFDPPSKAANYLQIRHIPTKLISLMGRTFGCRAPLQLLIRNNYDWVIYSNYVSFSHNDNINNALIIYDMSFLDVPETLNAKNLAYLKKTVGPSIAQASKIITISEFTKQRILYHFPSISSDQNILVTGIPPEVIDKNTRNMELQSRLASIGIKKNDYFLFLGTLEPRKNIHTLIAAFERIAISHPEATLVLAGGKGWKSDQLFKDIAHKQRNGLRIILTGYVSDKEKSALYANCHTYVFPSLYEGFGMPVLEAMQYERTCILSDIPVFREIAEDYVSYFDPSSVSSLAQVMQSRLEGPNSKASTSYEAVLSKYSWDMVAKKIIEELT